MKYEITKSQWGNARRSWLRLEVEAINEGGGKVRSFSYIARASDREPLAAELWVLAMRDPEAILDDETTLIISGRKPLLKGCSVVGNKIFNDAAQKNKVRLAMRQRLADLTNPENTARAEIDEGYAQKRKQRIREILDIPNQAGYPYEVEFPEEEGG